MNRDKPKFLSIGFIREHPRCSLATQRAALTTVHIDRVIDTHKLLAVRKSDVVYVYRAMLLADPDKRHARGGMRASLYATIDAIEEAGGTIVELSSPGRRSDNRKQRDEMIRAAVEELARTRSESPVGRPRKEWLPHEEDIIRKHWHDLRHASNEIAAAAMRKEGVKCSAAQAYHSFGKSGRVAGNPLHREIKKSRSVVYFLQRDPPNGPIKIGKANSVKSRIKGLRGGCAEHLFVIGTLPGSYELESKMHSRFASLRMKGEWFRHDGKLAAYLIKTFKS